MHWRRVCASSLCWLLAASQLVGYLVGPIVRPPPPPLSLLIQMTGWKRKNREAEKTRPHVQRFKYSVKSAGQFSLNSSDLLSSPRLSENDPCPFALCCIPSPRSFGRRRRRWCTSRTNRCFAEAAHCRCRIVIFVAAICLLRLRLGGAENFPLHLPWTPPFLARSPLQSFFLATLRSVRHKRRCARTPACVSY